MLGAAAIARLCAWLQSAELPAPPLDTLPGVQAFDVELLRRQVLGSIQVGDGDYTAALMRLRYLYSTPGAPSASRSTSPSPRTRSASWSWPSSVATSLQVVQASAGAAWGSSIKPS